jgi:DNA-binding SARP family transcriptional activator
MTVPHPHLPPLELSLLGPFAVQVNSEPLPRLRWRRGEAILALLTLRHDRPVERAWLAGLLWPESAESQGLATLRRYLTDLRRALGPEAGRLPSPTPASLALDLAGASVDLLAFDAALARGDAASLAEAVSLYRGPLLEGWTEEWVFQERQAREQAYLQALESLAAQALERDEPAAAERHLRQVVVVDPLRESAQRALLQVLAAGGNYAAVLESYRSFREQLHRELNAEPDPETRRLFARLRREARGRAEGARGRGGEGAKFGGLSPRRPVAPSPPRLARRYRHLSPDRPRGEHPAVGGVSRSDAPVPGPA